MYENIKEVEKNYVMTDFPLNIIVEVGNHCNLKCITCGNRNLKRKRGYMDIFLYKKIIDEVADVNPYTRIWLDFYGEPLLTRYKLYYMITYAKNKGLKNVSINTNGTLIDAEMAEMLLDSGIDYISIDCDGFSKEVYEKIRVGANRDDFYQKIEYFLERKRQRGMSSPIIECKTMDMDINHDEIPQIINHWRERGAWTAVRRLITWSGSCDDLTSACDYTVQRYACGHAIGVCAISWEGYVFHCALDAEGRVRYGNVKDDSIQNIWKVRNEKVVGPQLQHCWDVLPDFCIRCQDWQIVGEQRYDEFGREVKRSYNAGEYMQSVIE